MFMYENRPVCYFLTVQVWGMISVAITAPVDTTIIIIIILIINMPELGTC